MRWALLVLVSVPLFFFNAALAMLLAGAVHSSLLPELMPIGYGAMVKIWFCLWLLTVSLGFGYGIGKGLME